ncbi:MAG: hypothetical protein U0L17_06420, partial [Acutalibacteraceae bacterium]|nr:hypothetical protein [Acutalibacteraceae bacterium]
CRVGGRERIKIDIYFGFSLPQSRFARQLPRQREPIYTPTFAKEPKHLKSGDKANCPLITALKKQYL